MISRITRFVACVLFAYDAALAIPTISVKGSKFFTSDGDQFYIKGVSYSPASASTGDTNNLINGTQCKLDAPRIKDLGANVIRVYSVDPTLNHDDCMKAFADAGIYVLLDMATPFFSINRVNPIWTKELRNAFAQVVDGFQGYDNLLGFFAGNEIINDANTTEVAPYAKAVIADMKAYRDLMGYRAIPIGYSAADLETLRTQQQDYFNCGNDSIGADFFGAIRYSWCGDSSMTQSGYDIMYEQVDGYSIPYFLAENGCKNNSNPRTFDDQTALLGRQMNDRLSGNVIYQWQEHESNYGLVSYADSDNGRGAVSTKRDFSYLQSQWATLIPAGVKASNYDPTLTRRDCPKYTSGVWNVKANDQLPTLGVDGFTSPTRPKSSSTAKQTGSATKGQGAATSGANNGLENITQSNAPKGISTGVIVGIVLGALIGLALVLGVVLFFLRRARKQRDARNPIVGEREGGESDKVVANYDSNDFYGPQHHELPPNSVTQELDPARGDIATMRASEIATGASGQMGELPNGQYPLRNNRDPPPPPAAMPATAPEPSPYVQAQRKVEMSWLESEEARLRQRREQLMKQSSGAGA